MLKDIYLSLHTHLVQLASFLEARHAFLHQEEGDAMGFALGRGVCDGHHNHHVTHVAVGDVNLGAVEDPVITVLAGIGADSLQVTVGGARGKVVLATPLL